MIAGGNLASIQKEPNGRSYQKSPLLIPKGMGMLRSEGGGDSADGLWGKESVFWDSPVAMWVNLRTAAPSSKEVVLNSASLPACVPSEGEEESRGTSRREGCFETHQLPW